MSNLINKTRLQKFAEGLWTKIKGRYDVAFKEATISASDSADKKITLTRISETNPVDIDLSDYARLQDRNEFKQDVSADNVALANNSHIGNTKGFDSNNRSLGFRQLTTSAFVDGYVDHVKIYVESANTNTNSTWTVWAITKGANGKENDRVAKVICNSKVLEVNSITEGTETRKFVIIPVKESFENETYFIAKCTTHKLEVASSIKQEYSTDVINMNGSQPPTTPGAEIDWNGGGNTSANTAIMHLIGRESIGSLALKLKQTQADGSLYVLKSETTATGGAGSANKVVKLDGQGKLDKDMLPSIAINEYFEITDFTNQALQGKRYENGDVAVVTGSGVNSGKRYLCINKGTSNATTEFIELNSKDGVVTNVNGTTGAVTLKIEATTEKLQLKVNDEMKSEVDIISEADINSIINGLN